jgi:hypothetical protein
VLLLAAVLLAIRMSSSPRQFICWAQPSLVSARPTSMCSKLTDMFGSAECATTEAEIAAK